MPCSFTDTQFVVEFFDTRNAASAIESLNLTFNAPAPGRLTACLQPVDLQSCRQSAFKNVYSTLGSGAYRPGAFSTASGPSAIGESVDPFYVSNKTRATSISISKSVNYTLHRRLMDVLLIRLIQRGRCTFRYQHTTSIDSDGVRPQMLLRCPTGIVQAFAPSATVQLQQAVRSKTMSRRKIGSGWIESRKVRSRARRGNLTGRSGSTNKCHDQGHPRVSPPPWYSTQVVTIRTSFRDKASLTSSAR